MEAPIKYIKKCRIICFILLIISSAVIFNYLPEIKYKIMEKGCAFPETPPNMRLIACDQNQAMAAFPDSVRKVSRGIFDVNVIASRNANNSDKYTQAVVVARLDCNRNLVATLEGAVYNDADELVDVIDHTKDGKLDWHDSANGSDQGSAALDYVCHKWGR